MKIELKEIMVRELTEGYVDSQEDGVVGYGGKLDIRPPYQREFIYKEKQRDAVIDTITKEFPLNVMYWAVREDGNFEVIDGQQRTISICQYVNEGFTFNGLTFDNLQKDQKEHILNYKLMVYFCEGKDSEELQYGSAIRQEYLETAIDWISEGNIEKYMSEHQHDPNATALWIYFQSIISWVTATFPTYRREMKGIEWGVLYNQFKDTLLDAVKLEKEIAKLMEDEDVTKKSGIYRYVLTREEKHLSIRAFSDNQKRESYERQKGICPVCKNHFELGGMEADHITPWHSGGRTTAENCRMLCRDCNRRKSGK